MGNSEKIKFISRVLRYKYSIEIEKNKNIQLAIQNYINKTNEHRIKYNNIANEFNKNIDKFYESAKFILNFSIFLLFLAFIINFIYGQCIVYYIFLFLSIFIFIEIIIESLYFKFKFNKIEFYKMITKDEAKELFIQHAVNLVIKHIIESENNK
jgi:hypothetical protein